MFHRTANNWALLWESRNGARKTLVEIAADDMPDYPQSVLLNSSGAGTVTLAGIPTGKEWVVQQIGLATIPAVTGTGCVAVVARNGQTISTTNQGGGASAGGQPYYRITSADKLTVAWTGGPAGGQGVATFSYTEHAVGTGSPQNTGIV
jgi:hypothetical protein